MVSITDSQKFAESVFGDILDGAVDWISSNMDVDDIFEEQDIKTWVEDNCLPDDIFIGDVLKNWATENGFVEKE